MTHEFPELPLPDPLYHHGLYGHVIGDEIRLMSTDDPYHGETMDLERATVVRDWLTAWIDLHPGITTV